jgi:YesN/AraC family two-component response regulator
MESTVKRDLSMLQSCKSEEERENVINHLKELHKNDDAETSINNLRDIKERVSALSVEVKLLELQKYGISLTHIANNYLGKSRSYLSQRLHGNRVNGRKPLLNQTEIEKISDGLKETGIKLQKLSASLLDV